MTRPHRKPYVQSLATETKRVTAALSEELWYMIFEIIEEGARSYTIHHPLLQVLLVSKSWQSIAAPLIYRSAFFTSKTGLEEFARHLADGHWGPAPPENYVRHVAYSHLHTSHPRCDIVTILSLTSNLLSFASSAVIHQEIFQVTATSALSLRDLSINLPSTEAVTPILKSIQHLKQLRRLYLGQCHRSDSLVEAVQSLDPLQLPHLKELDAHVGKSSHDGIMAYLYKGRYQSLQRITLRHMEQDATALLPHFLVFHGQLLTRIDFKANAARYDFAVLPKDGFRKLVAVGFEDEDGEWPEPQWYSQLPPSVRHFHLDQWTAEKDIDGYVQHFESIVSGHCSVPFKFIHLDAYFSWARVFDESPEEAGVWARCAQRLKKNKGIALLDGKGLQWTLQPPSQ